MRNNLRRSSLAYVAFLLLISYLGCLGCTVTHYQIKKVTDLNQEGLRFNRPVPYLVVTNMGFIAQTPSQEVVRTAAASDRIKNDTGNNKTLGSPSENNNQPAPGGEKDVEKITMTLIWLPEKQETYAITVKAGWGGTFKNSITLKDGWMLTGIDEEGDTKTAETLTAVSSLVTGVVSSALSGGSRAIIAQVNTVKSRSDLFFYLLRIDLTNNTLKLVNSEELKDALTGSKKPGKVSEEADVDPVPLQKQLEK